MWLLESLLNLRYILFLNFNQILILKVKEFQKEQNETYYNITYSLEPCETPQLRVWHIEHIMKIEMIT